MKIQDKHNPSKVWIINETPDGYEWNQEIAGKLFYEKFQPVSKKWIEDTLSIKLDIMKVLLVATDLSESNPDKARGYIKGALQVKEEGKLSDDLRELLLKIA